jgi:hypothetical protein
MGDGRGMQQASLHQLPRSGQSICQWRCGSTANLVMIGKQWTCIPMEPVARAQTSIRGRPYSWHAGGGFTCHSAQSGHNDMIVNKGSQHRWQQWAPSITVPAINLHASPTPPHDVAAAAWALWRNRQIVGRASEQHTHHCTTLPAGRSLDDSALPRAQHPRMVHHPSNAGHSTASEAAMSSLAATQSQ